MNVVRKKAEEKGRPLPPAQGCLADGCAGCGFASACTGKSQASLTEAIEKKAAAPVKKEEPDQKPDEAEEKKEGEE